MSACFTGSGAADAPLHSPVGPDPFSSGRRRLRQGAVSGRPSCAASNLEVTV
jgi:hypothetical protein